MHYGPFALLQMIGGYGELTYQIGMATRAEADHINDLSKQGIDYIKQSKYSEAFSVIQIYQMKSINNIIDSLNYNIYCF